MGESRSIRNDILISLFTLPLYFVASGRYGLKILVLLGISVLVGFTAEKVSALLRKDNNTVYALPFWFLFPLVMPPGFPILASTLSLLFASIVCLSFFGGHGRNMVSLVAIAWAFAVLSFPALFSNAYTFPFKSAFHGWSEWNALVPTVDNPLGLLSPEMGDYTGAVLSGVYPQVPGEYPTAPGHRLWYPATTPEGGRLSQLCWFHRFLWDPLFSLPASLS